MIVGRIATAATASTATAGGSAPGALRLVRAARFYGATGTPGATGMVTLGERILTLGNFDELRRQFAPLEVVDLGGSSVIPGLNDAHAHPTMAARNLSHVDLSPERVGTQREARELLTAAVHEAAPGDWVQAARYDPSRYPDGEGFTLVELDQLAPANPVVIVHTACHWGVTNTLGLARGALRTADDAPPGGVLGVDAAGRLNGLLYEQAIFDYIDPAASSTGRALAPQPSREQQLRDLQAFLTTLHSVGLTSVTDALVGPESLSLLQEAREAGTLTARVNALIAHGHLDELIAAGVRTGFGDNRVRIAGIKAFVDGAVAGKTCLVEQPFADAEGHSDSDDHGVQVADVEALTELAVKASSAGHRLAVHANGDRAIDVLLTALERARAQMPTDQHSMRHSGIRPRIEHASIVTPALLARMKALDVIAVPFGSYVHYHGAKILDWYGADRAERMFAHRSLLDAGITVAGSSDYPCGPFEPLLGIQSCVTRRSAEGVEIGANQRISLDEAIALYTSGSAASTGEEHEKGCLAPGMLADFVALDHDPHETPENELAGIGIHSTWVGAQCVWRADE